LFFKTLDTNYQLEQYLYQLEQGHQNSELLHYVSLTVSVDCAINDLHPQLTRLKLTGI